MDEDLNIISSIFDSIIETDTMIDLMVIHLHKGILKKLILIECKSGYSGLNSGLTDSQKGFVERLKQIKSDKVEYKKINIDYRVPKQLSMKEYSLEDYA